jgi:hypothetical protein
MRSFFMDRFAFHTFLFKLDIYLQQVRGERQRMPVRLRENRRQSQNACLPVRPLACRPAEYWIDPI